MAGSVNRVILVGNLGRDPEVRDSQSGKIVNLSLATSEQWTDKASGDRRERTEWHRVVLFNERLAEVAEKYLRKGSKVYIEGALQTRKWVDQQGEDKYTTEVVLSRFRGELVLLDSRQGGEAQQDQEPAQRPSRPSRAPAGGGMRGKVPAGDELDDVIPF